MKLTISNDGKEWTAVNPFDGRCVARAASERLLRAKLHALGF